MDMAELVSAILRAATHILPDVQNAGSPAQRLAAQAGLLMRIRELCQYAHVDSGLEEVTSCLFAVTHQFHRTPMIQGHVEALRDVFDSMREIAMSVEDVDACLDRLDEVGLSIYDVFGEDEVDPDHR